MTTPTTINKKLIKRKKTNTETQAKQLENRPDLLQALKVIPELHVQSIGDDLRIFTILVVLLSVQKPVRDLELAWVGHDGHQVVELSGR